MNHFSAWMIMLSVAWVSAALTAIRTRDINALWFPFILTIATGYYYK
jgi:hypothetical protein